MKKNSDGSCTIGVLIGNANSPHAMDLLAGTGSAAKKLGVNLIYYLGIHNGSFYRAYFGEDSEKSFDYQFNVVYDYTAFGGVDALIMSYGTMSIFLGNITKEEFLHRFDHIPYVLVEERDETGRGSSIIADNYRGMYELAEHLVRDHGYHRITYLAGPPGNTDAEERMQAVRDVMKEYGIPFDESHVAYGDFSFCVEEQANELLDRFPDAEAMICANDVMAYTVYQECAKRNIIVGRDLAVTGYDDWRIAEAMNPALTTVLQNAYDMGYMAVSGAVELCRDNRSHTLVVPAQVKYRSSCGCRPTVKQTLNFSVSGKWELERTGAVDWLMQKVLRVGTGDEVREQVRKYLEEIFQPDFRVAANREIILNALKRLLSSDVMIYISAQSLARTISEMIDRWLKWSFDCSRDKEETLTLLELRQRQEQLILGHIIKLEEDRFTAFQQESGFLPLITRDMMIHIENEEAFYGGAVRKLSALGADNSYLYIFDTPVPYKAGDKWECPSHMLLAACHEGERIITFPEEQRPVLSENNCFSNFYSGSGAYVLSVFCLFSGETQYGILVTEIEPTSMNLFYAISMQIGNALKYHELSQKQRQMQVRLERLVEEIREKNEVLNFLSEYDELTGVLNRRGFMERAMNLNRRSIGKKACLIYADLDHLKEINDSFGHMEGDYAICQCAGVLQRTVGDRGLVGRVGGDEFVVMMLCEDDEMGSDLISRMRQSNHQLNQMSDKEYFVEISMGSQTVTCSEKLALSDILTCADRELYEDKKKRRASVKKGIIETLQD